MLNWNSLWSAGIGASIGSSLTLLATCLSHRLQMKRQNQKDDQILMGFLQAIHDEIKTLWVLYMDGIGHSVLGTRR